MTAVGWMTAASVGSWLAVTAIVGPRSAVEVFAGMIGPLAVAAGSWVVAERTYRRRPARFTAVMIGAFGVKVLVFGAYVAIGLKVLSLRPIPFAISFTGYFIGLHLMEAVYLRRLLAGGTA